MTSDAVKALAKLTSIRESYVERFGEAEAQQIESAAKEHENGVNSKNKGSDQFKWAIIIVIGHQCAEKEEYRKYHSIMAPWLEIKKWIIEHANIDTHNGDVDYLALLAGKYEEFLPKKKKQ